MTRFRFTLLVMILTDMIAALFLLMATGFLAALFVIDLKERLLPNVHVLGFAVCGMAFHGVTDFNYTQPLDTAFGAVLGAGLLMAVRTIGNAYYKQDTLGLGDVKLMGAAGLWIGSEYIVIALALGALAGVFHGLILITFKWLKTKNLKGLSTFSLPAGPGFIIGIVLAGLVKAGMLGHVWGY